MSEKIANGVSEKEIFDERQNALRSRLGIEALSIFAGLAFACCASLDFYKWAENITGAILITAVLCLLWYLIRCTVKGCMVGISGRRTRIKATLVTTVCAVLQSIRFLSQIGEEGFLIKNGALSFDFMLAVCFVLLLVCGIFSLCVIGREEKRSESDTQK